MGEEEEEEEEEGNVGVANATRDTQKQNINTWRRVRPLPRSTQMPSPHGQKDTQRNKQTRMQQGHAIATLMPCKKHEPLSRTKTQVFKKIKMSKFFYAGNKNSPEAQTPD
jgi:hypothetical protein